MPFRPFSISIINDAKKIMQGTSVGSLWRFNDTNKKRQGFSPCQS
ncbi:hypothetical protein BAXH7_00553 [Bacillus amyloliquefaciens XH7]|nr:hypothetical protein LL3_00543 [Bacillus amyloliquefaciens LL3]AEK87699.1 hypothetical protein BAXH7_00553 [Bacillus amyloliquefaciens XH7]KYC93166.1 hypothetical protein B425_0536 [Bacillus amyloliquefaciens]